MKVATACAWTLVFSSMGIADDGDDSLRLLLSKSDLVVLGTIVSSPVTTTWEAGVLNHVCDVKVTEVLKGSPSEGAAARLPVSIVRFESGEDRRWPELREGRSYILFLRRGLKGERPALRTTDPWFAVQPPSRWMVRSLRRLARSAVGREQGGEVPDDEMQRTAPG